MSFKHWANGIFDGINAGVIPVLVGLAFVVFLFGVFKYFILHADNEESRRQGRAFIVWGLLGLVLAFSIWGVVYILLDTLGWR